MSKIEEKIETNKENQNTINKKIPHHEEIMKSFYQRKSIQTSSCKKRIRRLREDYRK